MPGFAMIDAGDEGCLLGLRTNEFDGGEISTAFNAVSLRDEQQKFCLVWNFIIYILTKSKHF